MNTKITAILMSLLLAMTIVPAMAVPTNNAVVTGSVAVSACPIGTIGMTTNVATMDFGELYPGEVSEQRNVVLAITPTGFRNLLCQGDYGMAPINISVSVSAGNWIGASGSTMAANSTVISNDITLFGSPVSLPVGASSTLSFIVTPPEVVTPDTYTQIITITGIY